MTNHTTELLIVPHVTKPGRTIKVEEKPINNYNLHKVLRIVSRTMIGALESQSNNAKAELVRREILMFRKALAAVKSAWESAKKHSNGPSASHEWNYKILIIHGTEVQKCKNMKIQFLVLELHRLASIILDADSAGFSSEVAQGTLNDIEDQLNILTEEMTKWLGDGTALDKTGENIPVFKMMGDLVPSVDLDFADRSEPSADSPLLGNAPDVPDLPVNGD